MHNRRKAPPQSHGQRCDVLTRRAACNTPARRRRAHTAAMSDSNFSKLCEWKKVHEVVDEAWAEDCLSDDEVELPAGETFGDEGSMQRPSQIQTRVR